MGDSCRYIFVTGGVVSSLGKGIAAASLGTVLEKSEFRDLHDKNGSLYQC